MKCPWCSNDMIPGKLYGPKYALRWVNEDQKLLLGRWFTVDGDKIGKVSFFGGLFGHAYAMGHRCLACKKIVIDESATGG
jgi:hypothetical protein